MHGQKPRLLICVGEFVEGAGQSRVVLEEVQHLNDRYEITIASNLIVWNSPINATLEHLKEGRNTVAAALHLRSIIRRHDIVHCHDSLVTMLIAATASKPWVVTAHGIAPIRLRSTMLNRLQGAITLLAYPILYRRATELVAISPYIRDWLISHARKSTTLIPNGAPPVSKQVERRAPTSPTLLYVGEISRRKGLKDLIRSAALLPSDVNLTLVGRGDISQFRRFETDSGASISYLGLVTDSQLSDLYEQATCVISASYWEGFGLPIVEGFAHGTPALVRNSTNMRNLILDSSAGKLFNTIDQIPLLLREIIDQWAQLHSHALDYARHHSWEDTFEQYHRLFQNLI